jgi:hypothetical protein
MQRRRFLKLVAAGAGGLAIAPCAVAASRTRAVRCHVAGVSFNGFDVTRLREETPVFIRRERFRGDACYRIVDLEGATIGFVPKSKIPLLENHKVVDIRLSKVSPHAVPWKQLEATILLS